jgi:glycosyltransferase involved in cell wall biosynthesis
MKGHEVRVIDYEILWRTEGRKELLSQKQVFHIARIIEGANITVIRPRILKIPVIDYVSMLFTYTREINHQIREFNPDVIISNDILSTYLTFKTAKKRGIPNIYYIIDIEHKLVPYKFLQPIGKIIEGKNIRNANLVVAINEGLREYTIRMGAKPERTLVLRAGIDPQRYDPGIDGRQIREEYGIGRADTVLFFMGWLYHFSGLQEVIEGLAKTDNKNTKLLIVGDGEAYNDLQIVINKHGMQDRVILTGKKPLHEIPKLIASSDLCLLPAHNNDIMGDIVPIKMYEYMAMGKPVISTKLPGIMKEFGENNGVVYVDSPDEVLTKTTELIKNGEVGRLGLNARSFVESNDWDSITNTFADILKQTIKENQDEQIPERI